VTQIQARPVEHTDTFGDNVDRLITVEMRNAAMPFGKIIPLYDAARQEAGDRSLCMAAARGLRERVGTGDTVLIVTGAGTQPLLPHGENDGPVGAAVIGRAIAEGLGALPVYVVETHHEPPMVAASEAIGLPVRDIAVTRAVGTGASVVTAPVAEDDVASWAERLFDELAPKAIVAIERLGPNDAGVMHGSTGLAGWSPQVDLSPLFTQAAARGVFSVGIGDAGNEIGFGRIADTVRDVQPHGRSCQCPCGRGMATVVATDVLIVAAVSNWGAYGLEAALANLLEHVDLPHSPDMARRTIDECLRADGLEALHCTRRWLVDGIDADVSVGLVHVLNEMVKISLSVPTTGPLH
jgi:hypothetical protein